MAVQNSGDSLLEMFIFETLQNTEQLEQIILDTEKEDGFSNNAINEIFRIMHTIKGSAAMMSYPEIASLAHKAEDLFYFIRENKDVKYSCSHVSDLILLCMDYINNEVSGIRENRDPNADESNRLIEELDNYLCKLKGASTDTTNSEKMLAHISYKAIFYFEYGCEMENIRAYSIIRDMREYAYDIVTVPENVLDNDETTNIIRKSGFLVYFTSDKAYSELQSLFMNMPFIRDIDLTLTDVDICLQAENENTTSGRVTVESESEKIKNEETLIKQDNHSSGQSIISINISKLDKLMNLVGEVVISESMVANNPDLKGLELQSFQKEALQLHKIIVEMQDLVMSMRLVPLTTTFQKTHRIVRDMSKKLGKEVNLELSGEDTEVDKSIIEHLSDPLMHLVRNCIDHGLESEEVRIALNKPAIGTITLEAYNSGSNVYILVHDDGRGLNKEKILEKARNNNILTKPESEMTDKEICSLIFLPGFSTNAEVSEFSGRGVGLDVVMQNITSIGGSVSVESTEGMGTTVTMKIPLTVAIIDGMNIKVGAKNFTIPITAIRESFKPENGSIFMDTEGNEMIMVRGECYAIMKLHKQWDIETEVTELSDGILIMVEQEEKRRCIFADCLLGQQQVVVKSMPDYIKRI
ncbi:MAG: chemotaxis protein CheA, partial [Eubacteriales bacterium]|nr:chemotaxis protein CheA [Eubacteriales bacterium]